MMSDFNIILIDSETPVLEKVQQACRCLEKTADIRCCTDFQEARQIIGRGFEGPCIIDFTDPILAEIRLKEFKEFQDILSGLNFRHPLVAVVPKDNFDLEPLFRAGVEAAFTFEELSGLGFASFLNVTNEYNIARKIETDKAESIQQELVALQDTLGRVDEMTSQYIGMAEDFALAKEELEQLNQEKNKIFSIIAHDLKSPFNVLLGLTELMKLRHDQMDANQVKEYTGYIHQSATQAYNLLDNLLNWASSQLHNINPCPDNIKVDDIIQTSLNALMELAKFKKVTIVNEVQNVTVFSDPGMLDAIIRNFVNNAVKFTPEMGTVTISATHLDGFTEINVKDTGIGIPEENLDNIFSTLGGQSTPGTNGEVGTGIGLTLCKEFAEKINASIRAKSTEGQGSTFSIRIPTAPSQLSKVG